MAEPDWTRAKAAVLYDAECEFCRWGVDTIIAMDRQGRLRAVAIQSAEGARLLRDLPASKHLDSWHLVTDAGEVTSAGAALVPLLHRLPAGHGPAALLRRFPNLAERAYWLVADHRSALSKLTRGARRMVESTRRAWRFRR